MCVSITLCVCVMKPNGSSIATSECAFGTPALELPKEKEEKLVFFALIFPPDVHLPFSSSPSLSELI